MFDEYTEAYYLVECEGTTDTWSETTILAEERKGTQFVILRAVPAPRQPRYIYATVGREIIYTRDCPILGIKAGTVHKCQMLAEVRNPKFHDWE